MMFTNSSSISAGMEITKRIATFNNEADAKRRVDQIWSTGQTASIKPREV